MGKKLLAIVLSTLVLVGCAVAPSVGTSDVNIAGQSKTNNGTNSTATTKHEVSDTIWLVGSALPSGMNENYSVRNMPTRQQICYQSKDGAKRVILDIQRENTDIVSVDESDKTKIAIGQASGTTYVYHGELIEYPSLEEKIAEKIYRPEKNETVLEWQQGDGFCRLFGTLSETDLAAYAATVEVKIR